MQKNTGAPLKTGVAQCVNTAEKYKRLFLYSCTIKRAKRASLTREKAYNSELVTLATSTKALTGQHLRWPHGP